MRDIDLVELCQREEIPALMQVLQSYVKELESDVMRVDLSVTDDRILALTKARAEGARKLALLFEGRVMKLRNARL
jgi:hypothetical protein